MSASIIFDALATRQPDSIVLRDHTSAWTVSDIFDEIDEISRLMPDCRVLGILADNSPDWVITDLAALRTDTVLLPLPGFFSPDQFKHALEQTAADMVVTDQPERIKALALGFRLHAQRGGLSWFRRIVEPVLLPEGTAKISFTSGSTGNPKGVCLSARGLTYTAAAVNERLADLCIERHLAVLPLSLLLENSAGVYTPILRGGEIWLPRLGSLGWKGMSGFDSAALQATVDVVLPNSLILVPELLKAWTLHLSDTGRRAADTLSYVAVGGARVERELLSRARELGIPAYQGYGLTECGSVVCLNRPGDEGDKSDGVGRPLGHVHIILRKGEIFAGTSAFLGHLGAPPTEPGAPFATGDLGQLDNNGHLHLSGRRKNLLITSFGRNISPEWVEAALLAQPAIAQAIVIGEAQASLSALIVPAPQAGREAICAAIERANRNLPDYARIGQWTLSVPFTLQNGLATGNGRPVRAAILKHYAGFLASPAKNIENKEITHAFL